MSDQQKAEQRAYQAALKIIERARARGETVVSFDVMDCRALANIPDNLLDIPGLSVVDLDNTHVSDLALLRGLTGLHTLDLNNTEVRDLDPLRELTGLQTLRLRYAKAVELAPLVNLSGLQVLRLDHSSVVDLSPLRHLHRLRILSFDDSEVRDLSPLSGLKDLEELSFNGTAVSDILPLRKLKLLQTLWLDSTNVADLRPVLAFSDLGDKDTETFGLRDIFFNDTRATELDGELALLAAIEHDGDRTRQTLAYLRTLPPWPEPLPWLGDDKVSKPVGAGLPSAKPALVQDRPIPKGLKRLSLSDARQILEMDRPLIRDRCQFVVAAIDDALASHLTRIPNEPDALQAHSAITNALTLAKAAMVGIYEAVPEDFSDRPIDDVEAGRLRLAFNTALARLQQAAAYVDRKDHTPTYGGLLKLGAATAVGSVIALAPGVAMATAVPAIYACLYGPEAAKAVFAILKGGNA